MPHVLIISVSTIVHNYVDIKEILLKTFYCIYVNANAKLHKYAHIDTHRHTHTRTHTHAQARTHTRTHTHTHTHAHAHTHTQTHKDKFKCNIHTEHTIIICFYTPKPNVNVTFCNQL